MSRSETSLRRENDRLESLVLPPDGDPRVGAQEIERFLDRLSRVVERRNGPLRAAHARMFLKWKLYLMHQYNRVYASDIG